MCICEKDKDTGRPEGAERVPVHAHACAHTFPGRGWGELRRTDHMLSQEQGGVPLWSGMGLAAGWPGSSKPPQTEWVLLKSVGEEGAVGTPPRPPHTDAHSGVKTHDLLHCGPVLKGSCSFGNSPVFRGQARVRQRGSFWSRRI